MRKLAFDPIQEARALPGGAAPAAFAPLGEYLPEYAAPVSWLPDRGHADAAGQGRPLAPARGLLLGLLLGATVWFGCGALALWVWF